MGTPLQHGAPLASSVPIIASNPPPSEAEPFLWLVGFALCVLLHLVVHPQARLLRDALKWLGRHPAPLLWLLASLMVREAWSLRASSGPVTEPLLPPAPGPELFWEFARHGWQRFALLFHQAIAPPPLFPGTFVGAVLMALCSATGQMWLCCYFIASHQSLRHDAAFRQTLDRWRTILALAACHLPWWWLSPREDFEFIRNWMLPEFLIFLAPLPLIAAASKVDFLPAGARTVRWWRQGWLPMLIFALTALPLLVLLEYALHVLPATLPPYRMVSRVLLGSVLSATLHCWLFVSAALLLLRGGYVVAPTPSNA